MQVEQSGVSGQFPLSTTSTVTETQIAFGYEVTVAYSVIPEEIYAGPPTGAPPKDDEES
jgi:hypothetical protein